MEDMLSTEYDDLLIEELVKQSSSYPELVSKATSFKWQIETDLLKYLPNKKFNKYTPECKKKWYRKYLRARLTLKVYQHVKFDIYGIISQLLDDVLPKAIDKSYERFVSYDEISGTFKTTQPLAPFGYTNTEWEVIQNAMEKHNCKRP